MDACMNLVEYLRDPDSRYILIPVVTAVLSVFAKLVCQNDKVEADKRWDLLYLAPNLLMSNFIVICGDYSKVVEPSRQQLLNDMCFSALLLNIGMSVLIFYFIRKWGWDFNRKTLRLWRGILIPDLISLGVMYMVFNMLTL